MQDINYMKYIVSYKCTTITTEPSI